MALIDFPTQLPLPINSQQSFSETSSVKSIPLAKGSPIMTRWAEDNSAVFQLIWVIKAQELRALQGFYDLILNKGTEWFNLPIQWAPTNIQRVTSQEANFFGNPLQVANSGRLKRVASAVVVKNLTRV